MLIELLVVQMCQDFSGKKFEACSKGVEAVSIQTGVKDSVVNAERATTRLMEEKIVAVTGKQVAVAAAFAFKAARDKSFSTKVLRQDRILPSVTMSADLRGCRVLFGWEF